jgi:hypothetical protein
MFVKKKEFELKYVGKDLNNHLDLEKAFLEIENLNGNLETFVKGISIDYLLEGIKNSPLEPNNRKDYLRRYAKLIEYRLIP